MVKPRFELISNNKDITENIAHNFCSLRVTEQIGGYSDSLSLTLTDADNNLKIPDNGTELKLSIGFDNTLTKIGLFIVDEVSLQSPPNQMTITARSTPFFQSKQYRAMQTQKTRHFENITLSALAQTIAHEYNLKPSIAERFSSISYTHINQQDESDINLLRRITGDLHARLKITDGLLALVDLNAKASNRGDTIPSLALTPSQLSKWDVTLEGRTQYKSVVAAYRDLQANETIEVKAGSDEPTRRLPHLYESRASALRAANARLIADTTGRGNFKASMLGNPNLKASMGVELTGFRDSVDAKWQIISVEHLLNNQGFITQFSATID